MGGARKRVAIVGAGPIGLEAAIYARRLGHEVQVFERGSAGEHVGRWGHVRMFTPWRMNISALAAEELERAGWTAPDPEVCPTGAELCEHYLLPLSRSLGRAVETGTEVVAISRDGLSKGEGIGGDRRRARPFRLLLRKSGHESFRTADVVVDASGTYGSPNGIGPDGLPAAGEGRTAIPIERGIPDLLGRDRAAYERGTIVLIGSGHSAATSLIALQELQEEGARRLHVFWVWRSELETPFHEIAEDPLPARAALAREGNRLARDPPSWLDVFPHGSVMSFERHGVVNHARLEHRKELRGLGVPADRIIANTGYRPDLSLERELQAHFCYVSEGSMRLAAKLLGSGPDCLSTPSVGPDAYRHPEPDFFVLGQKSYGRASNFLLAKGLEGVRDVFRIVEGDADLDLHGGRA